MTRLPVGVALLLALVVMRWEGYSFSLGRKNMSLRMMRGLGERGALFSQVTPRARLETKLMATYRRAPDTGVGMVATFLLRQMMLVPLCLLSSIVAKICVRRWVMVQAGKKFTSKPLLYATIPLIAGLVNMITNKISVWMIFNPLNFMGKEFIARPEGSPAGFLGWQGIVPARVKSMSPDIARTLINLVNLKVIFARLDSILVAEALKGGVEPILDTFIKKALEDQDTNPLMMSLSPQSDLYKSDLYAKTLSTRLQGAIERIVVAVQKEPGMYLDLEASLVNELVKDKSIVCSLFQRVGRKELKFIVDFGLLGGMALGIIQAVFWLLWDPAWSLAVGGAFVGYLTNFIALAVMFRPIFPITLPLGGYKLQGLFLQRQDEVSSEFAQLAVAQLMRAKQLWQYLCLGPKRASLTRLIERELRSELDWVFPGFSKQTWTTLASQVLEQLPKAAEPIYAYMDESVMLERDIAAAMRRMPPDQFENVLHPIFEQDEVTLIAVGTVLGAAAGAAQATLY